MENPAPQPDIPDPASPTPAAPASPSGGGSRIRSRPTIVKASRLPGTYAANYGADDMNWHRGVIVLWTLFALAAVGECVKALFYLLAGHNDWPLPSDLVRVGVGALVFLALWLGWGWTRWLLVVTDGLFGVWLVMWAVAGHTAPHVPTGMRLVGPPPETLIENLPKLGLGMVYLITAAYLAFSADVIDFVRHRREEGRGWVFVPVTLLVLAYVAVLFTAQWPYQFFFAPQNAEASRFGEDTVRTMSTHWDPQSVVDRGDAEFFKKWTNEFRQQAFGSLAQLGALQDKNEVKIRSEPNHMDPATGWFARQYSYELPHAHFAHGSADIGVLVIRPVFGHWQVRDLQMNEVNLDSTPAATPASTPTP